MREAKDTSIISSFSKGLRVIEYILDAGGSVSVMEIAKSMSMDKASAYRFLATLERHGLVRKDRRTRQYSLGPKFLVWSSKAEKTSFDIIAVAKPHLKELANATGQEAHLAILSDDVAVLIDTASPEAPLSIRSLVGVKEPLHCTALGKCLLAFAREEEQERILKALELPKMTDRTITSVENLRADLTNIRERGYAIDDREHIDILSCIAAPVYNDKDVVGAIGVSAISDTVKPSDLSRLGSISMLVAKNFSREYQG